MAVVTEVLLFAKRCMRRLKPKNAAEKLRAAEREEKARRILRMELTQRRTDGKTVSHRRLESLILAAGVDRPDTVRLLRSIGARPSSRWGDKWWTLDPDFASSTALAGSTDDPEEHSEDRRKG